MSIEGFDFDELDALEHKKSGHPITPRKTQEKKPNNDSIWPFFGNQTAGVTAESDLQRLERDRDKKEKPPFSDDVAKILGGMPASKVVVAPYNGISNGSVLSDAEFVESLRVRLGCAGQENGSSPVDNAQTQRIKELTGALRTACKDLEVVRAENQALQSTLVELRKAASTQKDNNHTANRSDDADDVDPLVILKMIRGRRGPPPVPPRQEADVPEIKKIVSSHQFGPVYDHVKEETRPDYTPLVVASSCLASVVMLFVLMRRS